MDVLEHLAGSNVHPPTVDTGPSIKQLQFFSLEKMSAVLIKPKFGIHKGLPRWHVIQNTLHLPWDTRSWWGSGNLQSTNMATDNWQLTMPSFNGL